MSDPEVADEWEAPNGHEKINTDTLGFLTVKDSNLFWRGQELEVRRTIKFSILTSVFGGIVGGIAAVAALVQINAEVCVIPHTVSCRAAINSTE